MANKETRIFKSNTLEELRQKTNDIALNLGDNEQFNASLSDKTFNYNNVSAGDTLFTGFDVLNKTQQFDIKTEQTLDNTGGHIILTGSPSISGFTSGSIITQSNGYSATLVSASTEKLLVKHSSGTFDASLLITAGASTIAANKILRIIGEAFPIGVVRVYINGTESLQNLEAGGFHVPNYSANIPLLNSPTVTAFTEGSTVYQGANLASATFSGTVLHASSTDLKLKNHTGSFNAGTVIKLDGSSSTIAGANHSSLTSIDTTIGNAIELNTPASVNDDIKVYSPSLVDAVNELQDDVGITENLTTVSGNLVGAVNEIEAVFDASTHEISAGSTAFNVTSGEFTIDSSADIVLDADGGNVELKDAGVQYGSLTNTSGNVIVKSGTTTMLTGAGASATFAEDVTVTRDVDIDRNLNVDGTTELNSTLGVDGNFRVGSSNSSKFDVAASTGNTQIDGTLEVDGTAGIDGNLRVGSNKFNVTASSGNTQIDGTLEVDGTAGVDGNFRVGSSGGDKFNVTAASGNTQIDGTLNVDSTTTLNGTTIDGNLDLNGSVDVSTNATIHGVLDVDGVSNLDVVDIDGAVDMALTLQVDGNTTIDGVLDIGTLNAKFTNTNNVKLALNELHDELGNAVITGSGTPAAGQSNITNAVNSIDAEIGSTGYIGSTITFALDAAQDYIGTYSNTVSSTITGALNQLHTEIGTSSLVDNLPTDFAYNVTDHTTATNTMSSFIGNTSIANIGTTDTVTGALQKLHAEIGNSNLSVFTATDVSGALRELETEKVYLTSSSQQEIDSKLGLTGNVTFKDGGTNRDTMTFNSGTTLDLSNASLLLPGNSSNVNIFSTSFLEVDGNVQIQGFSVDRQHVTTITDKADVRLQWNENHADGTSTTKPARSWQFVGLDDAAASHTTDIVTFYNAKELITSNTESGINVTWDSTSETFDFNVNDPTITLGTGPISGNVTITNLGNATFNTTLDNNSVTLGTHTSGDYVRRVYGTTNQITVSPAAHTENKDATFSIPTDFRAPGTVKILGTTASGSTSTGALTVAGGVGIGEDLYVAGDLYVEGNRVELNVSTLEVEDSIIVTNSLNASVGQFGLGVNNSSGNIDHSLYYNYSNNQWEADGVRILDDVNSILTPQVKTNGGSGTGNLTITDLTGARDLNFVDGTGIDVRGSLSGTDINITITNDDKGSSQAIFKNFTAGAGGTATANINNDTITFPNGSQINTTRSGDSIIIDHANTSNLNGTYGQSGAEDGTYIKSVTVDANGHMTGVTFDVFDNRYDNYGSWQMYLNGASTDSITSGERFGFDAGSAITLSYDGNDLTINHADTSSVANLSENHSGNTFIQDLALTFDTFGHVTGATATEATVSIGDGTFTVSGSSGLAGSGSMTANQSGNSSAGLTNTDRGSSQYIFKNVAGDSGTAVADNNDDTLTISGGTNISTSVSGDTLTITNDYVHPAYNGDDFSIDSGPLTGATVISDIDINVTTDTQGHVVDTNGSFGVRDLTLADLGYTGHAIADHYGRWRMIANSGGSFAVNSENYVKFVGGTYIDTTSAAGAATIGNPRTITIDHADTSSQASVNNSGNTFIQDITLDGAGHVTALGSATVSIGNGQIDGRTSGLGLSGTMDATANQSGDTTFTVTSNATTASTANTIAYRDSGGDIHARLFRSEYDSTNASIGYIMTQVDTVSNNYIRPSTAAQVRSFLNVENGSTLGYKVYRGYNDGTSGYVMQDGTSDGNTNMYFIGGSGITLSQATNYDGPGNDGLRITNDSPNVTTNLSTSTSTTSVTINSSDGTNAAIGEATGSAAGVMSVAHHNKLDGIAAGANLNTFAGNTYSNNMNQYVRTTDNVHHEGLMIGQASGATANTIRCVGDIVAYYSDDRLKNKIGNIENALDKVNKLNGFTFTANQTAIDLGVEADSDRVRVGVSAQEVEAVLPEAVTEAPVENDQDYKTVQYEKMVPLLIEAIKELTEQNKELKSEVEILKSINT